MNDRDMDGLKVVLALFAAVIVGIVLVTTHVPTLDDLFSKPKCEVQKCKPALRVGWDGGPVIYGDKKCECLKGVR